ncbi:hypothetical protein [Streptomyces profundus]|uniref:hypothetical protein n=1 Tax=Streptomyces profundus TaxID=2867410 RepID=UPI001D16271B|nr:hypothetical protein [Streptomyces sp. MA3_2.13]UED87713.1 hypothetical protein K4G22_28890 [Streptomyces sp. MA3_2.13]
MRVGEAREAARHWVATRAAGESWFAGAYFSGSTVGLPDDAEVPLGSDTDVMVVTTLPEPPAKPGKFRHRGALIEISPVPWDALASPESVLSSYHLAGPFRTDTVIADPTGHLGRLRRACETRFAEPTWVRRRYGEARARVENGLRGLDDSAPWPWQVMGWLFPTGVTTHVLLVAGLRNPTVRLRYLRTRELLTEHGLDHAYPALLDPLGCAELTAERAEHHLLALADTFDTAAALARTPYFFSSDISPDARPIAIDATLRLIRAGNHREVLFWLLATAARCHIILDADATGAERDRHTPAFTELLADLGLRTSADLRHRAGTTLERLPELTETAERLLAAQRPVRQAP